jgi:hypothetical protein
LKKLSRFFADGRRSQRGSVLSGLLIMVALLSIIIGALMSQLSSSFMLSRNLLQREQREATVNSAVELGLYQMATSAVPAVCVRDSRGPWYVTSLNGRSAAVTQSCTAIVPDQSNRISAGSFVIDGIHEVVNGHNSFVVGDQTGRVRSYPFGTTSPEWSINAGGAITGAPSALADPGEYPDVALLLPVAAGGSCGGHCVALYDQAGSGAPAFQCDMAASAAVVGGPAAEVAAVGSPNFPSYAFFGDTSGRLYVYDIAGCGLLASQGGLGGAIIGQPIVFTGAISGHKPRTVAADIFVVVSGSTSTVLQHWQYTETSGDSDSNGLRLMASVSLAVGGNAVVSGPSSSVPTNGATIRVAVAGRSGRMEIGRIQVTSSRQGPTYTISAGATGALAGNVVAAPYWCHCPSGDTIGVGSTNGFLYLLDPNLNVTHQYDSQADGRPAIRSTPTADVSGDWYFGADDGYVYDVEVPATGMQLFKAARFGPGGAIHSSPVQGGCGAGPCLYFASTTAGSYFVRLGTTRIVDLRACVTSTPGSVTCAASPRLWARAEVGPPSVVGGKGISVLGWSYYSP